jgi:hypothetical protein
LTPAIVLASVSAIGLAIESLLRRRTLPAIDMSSLRGGVVRLITPVRMATGREWRLSDAGVWPIHRMRRCVTSMRDIGVRHR